MLEFSGQGSRKWFERRKSDFDLRKAREVFLDGAPLLAGKWLHEIGFREGSAVVTPIDGGAYRIDVPGFQLRAFLSPDPVAGRSSLVLSKVEILTSAGNPDITYEYSDFAVLSGLDAAAGRRRHVTLAPSNLKPMDGLPVPPAERHDIIVEAKVMPRFDDSVFMVSTEGFQDLKERKGQPARVTQPNPEKSPPPKAHD